MGLARHRALTLSLDRISDIPPSIIMDKWDLPAIGHWKEQNIVLRKYWLAGFRFGQYFSFIVVSGIDDSRYRRQGGGVFFYKHLEKAGLGLDYG